MCSEAAAHPRIIARTTGPGGCGAGAKAVEKAVVLLCMAPLVLIDRDLNINVTHRCKDEDKN